MKVSALILTFNEACNIERCLSSLVGIDDIVLVDSGSTDDTCSLAKAMGARILYRPFDNFANQRNYGLQEGALRNEWILHLDADEVLTEHFRQALQTLTPTDAFDGWRVPSKTMLNGQWLRHAGMYPTYQVRIGHRDRLRFKQVGHGQREDCAPERISTFNEPYLHYNFSHGLQQWFQKHVRYASDEAEELQRQRSKPLGLRDLLNRNLTERRRSIKQLVNKLPAWLRPPLRFFHVLIIRRGILDGRAGLQYALMLSAYESMIAAIVLQNRK